MKRAKYKSNKYNLIPFFGFPSKKPTVFLLLLLTINLFQCKKSVRIAKISILNLSSSAVDNGIKIIPKVRNIGAIQTESKLSTTCTIFAEKEIQSESVVSFLSLTPGEAADIAPVLFKDISVPKNTRFICQLVASGDSSSGTIEDAPMEGFFEKT